MLPALSLAPLTLAAVLVLSGLAKLRDPGSTASMIALLRLPSVLRHRVVPRALPVVELVTAALLVTPWWATYAAGAAMSLVLFTAFLVVIARAMTFDPRPTCGCFGRVGDHRVNGRTVGRNVLLLALAVVAAWVAVGGASTGQLVAGYGSGDWVWLVLALALAAVAVLVLGGGSGGSPGGSVSRRERRRSRGQQEKLRRRDDGGQDDQEDYVRSPVPRGVLLSKDLAVVSLHQLAQRRAQLLVLVNCWCGPTYESIERLPAWRERIPMLEVQLVHTHKPWDEPRLAALEGVWWDPGAAVYDALKAGASPAAVVLGADLLLAGGPVNGVDEIEELVEQIAEQLAEADVPRAEEHDTVPATDGMSGAPTV